MSDNLLPCPFCGAEQDDHGDLNDDAFFCKSSSGMLAIGCSNCMCVGAEGSTRAEAIAAWNRRALPARGVGVKPLVWQPTYDGAGDLHRVTIAYCPVFEMNLYAERPEDQPRIEAKRAARILAGLEPAPTDAAQAREAALSDRIAEALVAAQERAHRAYEQDAPFDPNEHKVRISAKDAYAILAALGPTDAAQAQPRCPYGATGDDCCGGYCDMDDRRE